MTSLSDLMRPILPSQPMVESLRPEPDVVVVMATSNMTVDIDGNWSTLNSSLVGSGDNALTAQQVFTGLALCVVILLTLLGNRLVIIAVTTFQRLRSVTNLFVVSLAVADLTVAILVMPYGLVYQLNGEWRFGRVFCHFWISCDVTCCTASILHLCVISLDRYLAITQPLTYKVKMSRRRATLMISCVWVCSSAISFVPIYMGWYADTSVVVDDLTCGLNVNSVYAVISAATSFYIPLVVMVIVYAKIFQIAQKQAREIKHLENQLARFSEAATCDENKLQKRSKKVRRDAKAIKTLGTLMGLFCVCWVPFFLMYVIMPFCTSCHLPSWLETAITWLGYTNSFINPCVYAFLNKDFRLAFKKILLCGRTQFWCTSERYWGSACQLVTMARRQSPGTAAEYTVQLTPMQTPRVQNGRTPTTPIMTGNEDNLTTIPKATIVSTNTDLSSKAGCAHLWSGIS